MEILHSQAALGLFGVLAVYFIAEFAAVAFKLWTPQSRLKTLNDEQLRGWRINQAVMVLGMAVLWLGLLLGGLVTAKLYWLALPGAAVYAVFTARMMKKYPYIDPATVQKSGKKKKKK